MIPPDEVFQCLVDELDSVASVVRSGPVFCSTAHNGAPER
jgi:hypothetical protein